MPVRIRAKRPGEKGKPWKIVEVGSGRVVGESDTKLKAQGSANVRNQEYKEKN